MLGRTFHGSERLVRAFTGAIGKRVSHVPSATISAHRHDWPNLTVQVLGSYTEEVEEGSFAFHGPSVSFQPSQNCHANTIGANGLETIGILFDPAWLGSGSKALLPTRAQCWQGGALGTLARNLAGAWLREQMTEQELAKQVRLLLALAAGSTTVVEPGWLHVCRTELESPCPRTTSKIARELGLHPAWLARRYRSCAGEGMHETARRSRTLYALKLLKSSDRRISETAAEAGFCDQAHMTRCFNAVLGQTPKQVQRTCSQRMAMPESE